MISSVALHNSPSTGFTPFTIALWENIQQKLRSEIGDALYHSWISALHLQEVGNGFIFFSAPTRFTREWIVTHYLERIFTLWREEDPSVHTMDVKIDAALVKQNRTDPLPHTASGVDVTGQNIALLEQYLPPQSDITGALLDPRFTFDQFMTDSSNMLAYTASKNVAESCISLPMQHNPFYIYGGTGVGKTHLMHAIGWHIRKKSPEIKVVYLSAEKFMYQFVRALRGKDMMAFKEYFRSVDVLMMDDIQFICGKESTQEEFFHTFATLLDNQKRVIVSCNRSPSELKEMDERVRSRLAWGLAVDIKPSSLELRREIIISKSQQMKVTIPTDVVQLLSEKITSNIRELEGALNKLVANVMWLNEPVTLAGTESLLSDLFLSQAKPAHTIVSIQKEVAKFYNIPFADIISTKRTRPLALARHVAMYLAKKLTSKSFLDIGKAFGSRDHTNVMHGVKRIENLQTTDASLEAELKNLMEILT